MVEIVSFLVATVVVVHSFLPYVFVFCPSPFRIAIVFCTILGLPVFVPRSSSFAVQSFFQEKEKLVLLAADGDVILASDINLLLDFNHTKIYI